ncbi:MAG: DNA repair protein RadC [Chloroflexi bacterium]|nr:DNA repair protein RadC [Chloroflexota bacterium]
MPVSERPRERLANLGVEALHEAELLALVLGRGTRGESVMVVAQKLLNQFGGLRGVVNAPLEELQRFAGIGMAKACQIKAIYEINRRLEKPDENCVRFTVKGPEDVVRYARSVVKGKRKECFLTLQLDIRNHILGMTTVSQGSLDSSLAHPREVFQPAVLASAASVILVHNHPSGDSQPSKDDIEMTRRLVDAGKIMGIEVLDHLIVCDSTYTSMKAKGLL